MKKPVSILIAAMLSIGLSSSLHADNRFGGDAGGAIGGTGSYGDGSVTVHHNLLPEERAELEGQIGGLEDRVAALEGKVDTLQGQVTDLGNNVNILNNQVANLDSRVTHNNNRVESAHDRIDALSARVSSLHAPTTDPCANSNCGGER